MLVVIAAFATAAATPASKSAAPRAPVSAPATDESGVRAVVEGIIEADNARDLERVLRHYADDAVLMPPNEPPVRGKPAIRPRYEELFAKFAPAIVVNIDTIEIERDLAIVSGRNGGSLAALDGGGSRTLNDAWVMILGRRGKDWKIIRLIWHSAGPADAKAESAAARR